MMRSALMICLIIIGAQISIPLPGMVPISLQTLAIDLCALLFERRQALVIALLYILMGAIGLPVFAGFTGGPSHLLGPAGGFIFSFPIMAYVISALYHQHKSVRRYLLAMMIGTLICYAIGVGYFMGSTKASFMTALLSCVLPFLPGDVLKMAVCVAICSRLKINALSRKAEIKIGEEN